MFQLEFCNVFLSILINDFILLQTKIEKDANFIAHNARLARNHQPPRPPSAMAAESMKIKQIKDMQTYQKGSVPN